MAHSSSGQGHRPLKAEIAGSNPACATLEKDLAKLREALNPLPNPVIRPFLIMLSGLPGSGKTFLCRKLKERLPAVVLESDDLRKRLFPQPSYSLQESSYLFSLCHKLIAELLQKNIPVILDATNLSEKNREFLYSIAERNKAKLVLIQVEAPSEVVQKRLKERTADPLNKSDADWGVYERMKAQAEPIRRNYLAVDTSHDITPAIEKILREVGWR